MKEKIKNKSNRKQEEVFNNICKEIYKEIDTMQEKILKRIDVGITTIFIVLTIFLIYIIYKMLCL